MSDPVRYQRNPAVSATAVDDEIFLVEPASQEVFYLDPVTAALWRCLEEPQDEAEIAALFGAAFPDTDPAAIGSDIAEALADMKARELVVIVP
ncbi:MAG: PqqD family peptide modification chaperone [Alphaproteobacteria bacterium]|nr:PqqD family peptide modification chaperone [Alphaproteobacteria bacterium]